MNLDHFKKSVTRAEQYLKGKGVEVTHTQLLEAFARYEGHRNFKTLCAVLNSPSTGQSALSLIPEGQNIQVFIRTHACGNYYSGMPDFAMFFFDNSNLLKLKELCDESISRGIDIDGDNVLPFDFIGGDGSVGFAEGTVSGRSFWATLVDKHTDEKVESDCVTIDELLRVVEIAVSERRSCVVLDADIEGLNGYVEELLDANDSASFPNATVQQLDEAGELTTALAAKDLRFTPVK